jgi:hypothetical protein
VNFISFCEKHITHVPTRLKNAVMPSRIDLIASCVDVKPQRQARAHYVLEFPIVPAGTSPKHDPVGHLAADGTVHVFNTGIIEKLVRAGLRARVREGKLVIASTHRLSQPRSGRFSDFPLPPLLRRY